MNPTFKQVTKTRYVQLVSELAQEIFVQHYTKLTPKVAAALADKYQSDILTDDEIHSGVINYFLIYLGTEPVGYFALDLGPAGAMCLSRLFLKEKARGQGIGRSIVAYAQKLAPTLDKDQIIVITISGRGDKDCAAIARYRGEDLYE